MKTAIWGNIVFTFEKTNSSLPFHECQIFGYEHVTLLSSILVKNEDTLEKVPLYKGQELRYLYVNLNTMEITFMTEVEDGIEEGVETFTVPFKIYIENM